MTNKTTAKYVSEISQDRPVEETKKMYDEWIEYDQAMLTVQYNGPAVTSEAFNMLGLDKNLRILDVGAGTGELGRHLHLLGYTNLVALEPSKLVETAKLLGVYGDVIRGFVKKGHKLNIPSRSFDIAIMCGVMTPGHMNIQDLEILAKVVRKGGSICWCGTPLGYYGREDPAYTREAGQAALDHLQRRGILKLRFPPRDIPGYYKGDHGVFFVMEVL